MGETRSMLPIERIERRILQVRGQKVMIDEDLAVLYGVNSKALVQAVKRNVDRFPADFMFQLSEQEVRELRSQFVTSIGLSSGKSDENSYLCDIVDKSGWMRGRGGRRHFPYAFTEQGVAMLSSVLRSRRAVSVNIEIMRAFVKLRALAGTHVELARKINELEKKYDSQFKVVFEAIRRLMQPPEIKRTKAGFDLPGSNR